LRVRLCRVFGLLLILPFLFCCSVKKKQVDVEVTSLHNQGVLPYEYLVEPGDSLFLIAWKFHLDDQALANLNNLKKPYLIRAGQRLLLHKPSRFHVASGSQSRLSVRSSDKQGFRSFMPRSKNDRLRQDSQKSQPSASRWPWPARGRIVAHYDRSKYQKGIDILMIEKESVLSASDGEVVYLGRDVVARNGNLCIVKHRHDLLSAYSGSFFFRVKVGQAIGVGSVIGELKPGAKRKVLHFEIRKNGQAVDPVYYLSPRSS
jgi:lipoprotein NlpD